MLEGGGGEGEGVKTNGVDVRLLCFCSECDAQ
jgi:hypothetical protein